MNHYTKTVAFAFALLSGCSGGQPDALLPALSSEQGGTMAVHDTPQINEIARTYRNLNLVTTEPVHVSSELTALCIGILRPHVEEAQEYAGPHAHTSIRIYMNEPAHTAFRKSAKKYPVGSIIVKEKQGLPFREEGAVESYSKTHDGVGGMIKRALGFDPEHGNWEYFYFEDASQVEQGKISTCIECHRAAAKSDFVFGHWAAVHDE
jgi:hypothetical protein